MTQTAQQFAQAEQQLEEFTEGLRLYRESLMLHPEQHGPRFAQIAVENSLQQVINNLRTSIGVYRATHCQFVLDYDCAAEREIRCDAQAPYHCPVCHQQYCIEHFERETNLCVPDNQQRWG